MAAKKQPPKPPSGNPRPGRPVGLVKEYSSEFTVYPGGKKRRLGQSTSVWQKMIEDRRVELDLSLREVAKATDGRISYNGLWQWLRMTPGFPNPRSYTDDINEALARALDIDPATLAGAYEQAKLAHGALTTKVSKQDASRFKLFRKLIQEGKASWTRADLLELIDGLSG